MKKKNILKILSLILFFLSLTVIYIRIYVFPSVKKINHLKREIREQTQLLSRMNIEKSIFIPPDKKEIRILRRTESEFRKKLTVPEGGAGKMALDDHMRAYFEGSAARAGIKAFEIRFGAEDPLDGEGTDSGPMYPGTELSPVEIRFSGSIGSGIKFINLVPDSPGYFLIRSVRISGPGPVYTFRIPADIMTKRGGTEQALSDSEPGNDLMVDMDSLLLKRPDYRSPFKLTGNTTDAGRIPE